MNGRRRLRVVLTVGIALLLVAITAGYGLWVMRAASSGHLMDPSHMGDQGHPQMDRPTDHTMMGASSSRGILGGYLGAVTGLMGLVFVVLVAILAWLLFRERPGRPEQALCPVCGATIETDWTTCAYCGSALTRVGMPAMKG